MSGTLTIEAEFHLSRQGRGSRRVMVSGPAPDRPQGRLPRITRLMALAIRLEHLVQSGEVPDYAELARRGQVSRARVTQIMNLNLLAPKIQEALLFLPRVAGGRDPIHLRQLQAIALTADWERQWSLWKELDGIRSDS